MVVFCFDVVSILTINVQSLCKHVWCKVLLAEKNAGTSEAKHVSSHIHLGYNE